MHFIKEGSCLIGLFLIMVFVILNGLSKIGPFSEECVQEEPVMSNINPAGFPEVGPPLDHFDDWDPTFGALLKSKEKS